MPLDSIRNEKAPIAVMICVLGRKMPGPGDIIVIGKFQRKPWVSRVGWGLDFIVKSLLVV